MPRDLEAMAKEKALDDMPQLTKSPEDMDDKDQRGPLDTGDDDFQRGGGLLFSQLAQRNEKRDELHPYTQTLSLSDLESCVRLEEEAFPPHERATREKFEYRLKRCGTLCMGIFTSHTPETATDQIPTAETSGPVYSGTPERKAVLLGHIVATKTTNSVVTDNDMAIPTSGEEDPAIGHKESGRTICIHSLAVLPQYQGRGLGKTLMKAYLQRMESSRAANRVALIAHEEMIPYYEGFVFENRGKSKAEFAGGGWYDMVRELDDDETPIDDDDDDE